MTKLSYEKLTNEVIRQYKQSELNHNRRNKMNIRPSRLIFSVFQADVEYNDNYANHVVMLSKIQDLVPEAVAVEGRYNGTDELGIMLPWSPTAESIVKLVCKDYSQETYLVIDSNNLAALYAPDGMHVAELGTWVTIDAETAKALPAYTKIGNIYFTTRK